MTLPPEQPVPLLVIFAPSILLDCNSFTTIAAAFKVGQVVTVGLANYLPDFVQPVTAELSLPSLAPVEIFIEYRPGQLPPANAFAAFVEDALLRLHTSQNQPALNDAVQEASSSTD